MGSHKEGYNSRQVYDEDYGVSYFSILSTIALAVLINLLIVNAFSSIFSLSGVIRRHQKLVLDKHILQLNLQGIAQAYDTHPFSEISPLIHAHTINTVIPLRGKHAALQGSTALFSVRTQFSKALFVTGYEGPTRLTACTLNSLPLDPGGFYLALGIDGITPLTASRIDHRSDKCLHINYQKKVHPFIPQTLKGLPLLLLPLYESSLLYIDSTLTLRHLAFFHGAIKENQPIRKLKKPVLFSWSQNGAYWVFHAHRDSDPLVQQSSRIPRAARLDILLNYQGLKR